MIGCQVNDDKQTRTIIHAFSGIRTHGLSIQAIKAYAQAARPLGPALLEKLPVTQLVQNVQPV
jgi:hypothetical protein